MHCVERMFELICADALLGSARRMLCYNRVRKGKHTLEGFVLKVVRFVNNRKKADGYVPESLPCTCGCF